MTEEQTLLAEIEAFLAIEDGTRRMADSTFGFKAANDGKLISRLRDGKTLTFEKARQIRAFMADPTRKPDDPPSDLSRTASPPTAVPALIGETA